VQKALRDSESYYLLGFDPEDQQFDRRYHSIKVRVKRSGLQVRTRGGFFGVPETVRPAPPRTRENQILSALFSPFGARDLKLQMTSFFFNLPPNDPNAPKPRATPTPRFTPPPSISRFPSVPGGPIPNLPPRQPKAPSSISFVRSLFHIDCSLLTFSDSAEGRKSVTLDLAAFAFNEDGVMVDQHGRSFTLSFDEPGYRLALAKGMVYTADVPISKPGAYQFRAVLRDAATGRLGSATQFLQIPDMEKKQLAISGLVLAAPQTAPDGTPLTTDNQTAQASEADVQPTPAVRRFARTGEIEYSFVVFNAQIDKRTHQPQLGLQVELFRDGKRAHQFPARPVDTSGQKDLARLVCGGRLQMKDFPPGDYAVRVIVTDALAKQKHSRAEQWMDFSVR
jgi:hypothetical protein